MSKYVIKFRYMDGSSPEYIAGGTYSVLGERYAAVAGTNQELAKRYTSRKRAENAAEKLSTSCANLSYDYVIEEVE